MKVLFVCTGNTCRSPMAEIMFKDYLKNNGIKNVDVSSAGLIGGGKPIAENSKLVLKTRGLSSKNHISKVIDLQIYNESDFIFTMTKLQKEELFNLFGFKKNVFSIDEVTNGIEIFDPYHRDLPIYEMVAGLIEISLPKLAQKIIES